MLGFFPKKAETHYSGVEQIVLIQDNLSTHDPSAFYQILPASQAFDMAQQFEMHYTPTNGSWLNMVEMEFSVLSRQCLNRRIPDIESLDAQVTAWVNRRNEQRVKVNWQFTAPRAREKFARFYPVKPEASA